MVECNMAEDGMMTDNEVINHLLFHKSLIDDHNDYSRINKYIEIVKKAADGEHVSIDDPFDKSISIAFELVIKQHINPWDIDLVNFSSLYIKKAKEEHIDLVTAGRIIYMAWKILKMQSHELVTIVEQEKNQPPECSWDDIPCDEWYAGDDSYQYTKMITNATKTPFFEPVRRKAQRKVSLIELLDAFDQVHKETEQYQLLSKMRREERERIHRLAMKRMDGTVHTEHLEQDIELIWERISMFNGRSIPLTKLYENGNKEDLIRALTSILFLAYDNKIRIYQRHFPFGKIYVKNIISN